MAKRNLKRERERRKALARQQRMIAAQKRRRRNQIIAGIVVATMAVGGVATAVVVSVVSSQGASTSSTDLPSATDALTETSAAPTVDPAARATYAAVPDQAIAEDREWQGQIVTSVGALEVTLDGQAAPQATANFIQLARDGYYDQSTCHRLTTEGIFVLQCGSLTGDGTDNPGYQFGPVENAPADGVYPAGTIAMARASAEDSQGAQFFIVYEPSTITGGYSVFGRVTSGLEAIEAVAAAGTADGSTDGSPATTVAIEWIELQ
ncbi:MAG: peptidylprolyl isomerase [Bifidobacteriaceae bacterium]|jgi:peptidyl-prolyl cis-trans isomerase B (cyclophilin B)|nr:peptidylprolyl isomerase [Bifidobacteriaceae bacterium]